MAGTELIVDDDYCNNMGQYFLEQGDAIDTCISSYIGIMERVNNSAIVLGETSSALSAYITQASKLQGKIRQISSVLKSTEEHFLLEVDAQDRYLF